MVLKLASVEKFGARGLETEEITGFSNRKGSFVLCYKYEEIAGHSNQHSPQLVNRVGLAEDKIT